MKQRIITAIFYIGAMLGIIALKIFVPDYVFSDGSMFSLGSLGVDVLFWLISIFGAFEFMRAVGNISKVQWWLAMITCILIIPTFVLGKLFADVFVALVALLSVTSIGMMVTASMMVFDFEESCLRSTALAELCILYCGVLACVGPNVAHLAYNSTPAIMLLFVLVPAVDTFAYFFGKLLGKKIPYKLAPHTSPNKTIIGAVGGIIGGLIAAVLVWAFCEYVPLDSVKIVNYSGNVPHIVLLMLFALPTAILAQLGDLFESAIKRGCNIKDMGKILPGHGGVLDRFDSMLFASVSIVVCFMLIY